MVGRGIIHREYQTGRRTLRAIEEAGRTAAGVRIARGRGGYSDGMPLPTPRNGAERRRIVAIWLVTLVVVLVIVLLLRHT
jgi:hypothetical protein